MPDYRYRALNPRGRILQGVLAARSPHDLNLQLQQAGMVLIESRATPIKQIHFWQHRRGSNLRDMAQLCRHLAQLEQASLPLTETLGEIGNSLPAGPLQQTLHLVRRDVEGGSSLSQAMGARPHLFRAPMPALVGAGEAAGQLSQAFDQLATYFDWQQQLRSKLTRTLGYPLFALGAMIAVVMFLLTTVIPETSQFLLSLNVKLPAHTRVLLAVADFAQRWGVLILTCGMITLTSLLVMRRRSTALAYGLDARLLKLPVAGSFLMRLELARFTQSLAMMLNNGIDLLPALGTATLVARNRAVRESLEVISNQIESGLSMSFAMRLSGLFPSLVLRIVTIGEEGSDLSTSMCQIATYYESDVQHQAEILVSALGPAITLVTGSLLVWLVLSIFMPIYDALPQLM